MELGWKEKKLGWSLVPEIPYGPKYVQVAAIEVTRERTGISGVSYNLDSEVVRFITSDHVFNMHTIILISTRYVSTQSQHLA